MSLTEKKLLVLYLCILSDTVGLNLGLERSKHILPLSSILRFVLFVFSRKQYEKELIISFFAKLSVSKSFCKRKLPVMGEQEQANRAFYSDKVRKGKSYSKNKLVSFVCS